LPARRALAYVERCTQPTFLNTGTDQQAGKAKRRRRFRVAILSLSLLLLIGCRTAGYYGQAARGQWRILADRTPIRKLTAAPETPAPLKEKLELALKLRAFAEQELKLPANGHYLSYVDVGREHVVWNVYAAPEFSLAAKTWWYPFVGRLKYRGYFAEADARKYALALERKGFETYVGGVDAYSTLGWFRDPVMNTFMNYAETDLAGVLFHELAHQRLFCDGDTDFNEAFASVVEEAGVRRWLKQSGKMESLEKYERSLQFDDEFEHLLARARERLRTVYRAAPGQTAASAAAIEQLRQRKAEAFAGLQADYARLREQWPQAKGHDGWVSNQVNNAKLASKDAYSRLAPGFRRLLQGSHDDLPAFYQAAARLAKLPKAERHRRLE
jgi:predicted aminopeptidase